MFFGRKCCFVLLFIATFSAAGGKFVIPEQGGYQLYCCYQKSVSKTSISIPARFSTPAGTHYQLWLFTHFYPVSGSRLYDLDRLIILRRIPMAGSEVKRGIIPVIADGLDTNSAAIAIGYEQYHLWPDGSLREVKIDKGFQYKDIDIPTLVASGFKIETTLLYSREFSQQQNVSAIPVLVEQSEERVMKCSSFYDSLYDYLQVIYRPRGSCGFLYQHRGGKHYLNLALRRRERSAGLPDQFSIKNGQVFDQNVVFLAQHLPPCQKQAPPKPSLAKKEHMITTEAFTETIFGQLSLELLENEQTLRGDSFELVEKIKAYRKNITSETDLNRWFDLAERVIDQNIKRIEPLFECHLETVWAQLELLKRWLPVMTRDKFKVQVEQKIKDITGEVCERSEAVTGFYHSLLKIKAMSPGNYIQPVMLTSIGKNFSFLEEKDRWGMMDFLWGYSEEVNTLFRYQTPADKRMLLEYWLPLLRYPEIYHSGLKDRITQWQADLAANTGVYQVDLVDSVAVSFMRALLSASPRIMLYGSHLHCALLQIIYGRLDTGISPGDFDFRIHPDDLDNVADSIINLLSCHGASETEILSVRRLFNAVLNPSCSGTESHQVSFKVDANHILSCEVKGIESSVKQPGLRFSLLDCPDVSENGESETCEEKKRWHEYFRLDLILCREVTGEMPHTGFTLNAGSEIFIIKGVSFTDLFNYLSLGLDAGAIECGKEYWAMSRDLERFLKTSAQLQCWLQSEKLQQKLHIYNSDAPLKLRQLDARRDKIQAEINQKRSHSHK